MFSLDTRLLMAASLLSVPATAQNTYTVWASVAYVRAGDHTPISLGYDPTVLTSLGAQQLYSAGQFFRQRYIGGTSTINTSTEAPLVRINANTPDEFSIYAMAQDSQYTAASAQAFMQGLYPPHSLNSSSGTTYQPYDVLANGTYLDYPSNGLSLPHIHTVGPYDINYATVAGHLNCPALSVYAQQISNSTDFGYAFSTYESLYMRISDQLDGMLADSQQDFYNAWDIYDYMSYLYIHNSSVKTQLDESWHSDQRTNFLDMDGLRFASDQQQYAFLGNLSAKNPYNHSPTLATSGSISTIAGSTLAARILSQLSTASASSGSYYKFSVLFGDYDPMMSLFALTQLSATSDTFKGMPLPGSALVFELFSYTNATTDAALSNDDMPPFSDLWVRFLFRNGTGSNDIYPVSPFSESMPGGLQAYSLFGRGPNDGDMSWSDFQRLMVGISTESAGDWCTQCGSSSLFCAAWNSSVTFLDSSSSADSSRSRSRGSAGGMNAAVAGVIGAIIMLAVTGLVAALLVFVVGVRAHRTQPVWAGWQSRKSELGGFKGSKKLASDQDLTLSKDGARVAAVEEKQSENGEMTTSNARERVGSWELKDQRNGSVASVGASFRRSAESERIDPFMDPVKPVERV